MTELMPLNTNATGLGQVYATDPRLHLKEGDTVKMKTSAQAFEEQYVFQLMELMAPKVDTEGPFNGGSGEETFRPQLHQAMAKQIVKQGGFGIAENVYKELLISQARGAGATVTPDEAAESYKQTKVIGE